MDPLVFTPYARPMVWGHRRLETHFGKQLPGSATYGEAWEISAHPHHVSVVAEGPHRGARLTDLLCDHGPAVYGSLAPKAFPLLVKLLDCHDWLSIQVHPADDLASRLAHEAFGKTEAWVVLAVEPNGRIYAGLKPGVDRAALERHLAAGTTDQCLHRFQPEIGDCVFLPAGTVHAVGGGVVIAEVQQSSDATFRLFDWNRVDGAGRSRPLHVRESLEAIDWGAGPVQPVKPRRLSPRAEQLVRCPHFHLDRYEPRGALADPYPGRMAIWMVLEGTAVLHSSATGYRRRFGPGETVLIPASAAALEWDSRDDRTQLLGVTVPG